MRSTALSSLLTIGLAAVGAPSASAADFSKIKFPHDNPTIVGVINNAGAVAGQHGGGINSRAFIRAPDGTFIDFAVDGAVVTVPRGLTDEGAVAGRYDLPDDTIHGFFRDSAGNLLPFDGPGLGAAEIDGMNAANDIVGTYFRDQQQNLGGFIRHPDGSFTLFRVRGDTPAGLHIAGISGNGEIAGYYSDSNFVRHAFIRHATGKIVRFQAPDAATDSFGDGTDVTAISRNGWITGHYTDQNGVSHHYLRNPKGKFEEFDLPGGQSNQTNAVNDNGEVTGCFSASFRVHGFIRKAGSQTKTFDLPWGDTEDMCVEGINNSGQLAGYARYGKFGEVGFGFIRTP